ncbi:MAG: glycosyltransferase family 39 protein [Chloroflexota bacterium]
MASDGLQSSPLGYGRLSRIRGALAPGLLLLGFLALSLALGVANPLWEALDEPEHFQYVKFIAERHQLPRVSQALPSLVDRPANELFQPPLYYVMAAPFVLAIHLDSYASWVRNPYFTWPGYPLRNGVAVHTLTERWPFHGMVLGAHVMRLVSSLMGMVSVGLIYLTARRLLRPRLALLAGLVSGLTPVFLMSSSSIDNDNAAALTSALSLLVITRLLWAENRRYLWFAALGVALGLALLAKANTIVLLPIGLFAAGLIFARDKSRQVPMAGPRFLLHLLMLAVALMATSGWYYFRKGSTDNYLSHYALRFGYVLHDLTPGYVWGVWREVFQTYWGSFGWDTFQLPAPFYLAFGLLTALAGAGWLTMLARNRCLPLKQAITNPRAAGCLLLGLTLAGSLGAVVLWHSVQLDDGATAHARFMLPALTASSILLAVGLDSLPFMVSRVAFPCLFAAQLAAAGYALRTLPVSFGGTLPVYGDARSAMIQHHDRVVFHKAMEVRGWTDSAVQVKPGGDMRIRLFWQSSYEVPSYPLVLQDAKPGAVRVLRIPPPPGVLVRPDFDYSAFVRLVSRSNDVIHDRDHGPGTAIGLPPHAWQPGEVIPDDWTIRVPATAKPGVYRIEVGVYDYRNGAPILTRSGARFAVIGKQAIG